jgi:predicted N-acetyltransferase YhbS
MSVRPATPEDAASMAALRASWRQQELTAEFETEFREWLSREWPSRWWWVAVTGDGRVVGMVNLKLFDRMPSPGSAPTRWGYLANLYVLPEFRGGAGGALVAAVIERARTERLVRVVLKPSELAVPLYGRFGFRPADSLLVLPLG